MNKTAIKNFAIWARNKLIAEIQYKAGLLGITDKEIKNPLPQSTQTVQFFEIGTKEPYAITGVEIAQRRKLAEEIRGKADQSDYSTAYKAVVEAVAYTWFNRLIAIRFMEVNDYLPSRIRVLSSESAGKVEPDLVTRPFEADFSYSPYEKDRIVKLQQDNQLDELFRLLFIKQCNTLNAILPALFEKTDDFTELLLNISFTDQDGVVRRLVIDIAEDDFKEAVEIIGWMYQYYNEERRNQVINIYKGTVKKEDIPAATQLFTTDWVVRYMVDNSLGRYWIERNPNSKLREKLTYYVAPKSGKDISVEEKIGPTDLSFFDPCMGSGHILVYAFDVLMEIYRECGYSDRDAAACILQYNVFGLDIDDRAYQLAYFSLMMKARSYNRRVLTMGISPNICAIQESNGIDGFIHKSMNVGADCQTIVEYLLKQYRHAKEIGSLQQVEEKDYEKVEAYILDYEKTAPFDLFSAAQHETFVNIMRCLLQQAKIMSKKYLVVCTNPPYMNKLESHLKEFVIREYKPYSGDLFSVFIFRNFGYCKPGGYSAFMTPFVWMFIKTYENLREYIINNKAITTLVQMEYSAFEEATVPICSFVLKNAKEMQTGYYFKLSDFKGGMDVQKKKVLEAIADRSCDYLYETNSENFSKIPGMPIAYWVNNKYVRCFLQGNIFVGETKKGILTGDEKKFVRLWYEVENRRIGYNLKTHAEMNKSCCKWFPVTGGGVMRKWYGNFENIVNLLNDGFDIKQSVINFRLRDPVFYMREAVTWTQVTSGNFSCRYVPTGILFGDGGPVSFFSRRLKYNLGLLNSKVSMSILSILAPTINYGPEQIKRIPYIVGNENVVEIIVTENIQISKIDWDSFETSWDFKRHPLFCGTTKISDAFARWQQYTYSQFAQLKANEEELNRIFIDIYGLQDELTPEVAEKDITIRRADLSRDIRSFLSYAVGCMFGRYSLDVDGLAYAGGEWDAGKYIRFIPDKDNILPITDEEYFEDDIVGRFVEFVKQVYGPDTLEENLDFIANALGNKGNSSREVIRQYFLKDFFKNHCQIYQKRPIYWLFDSGKENGFKALIYLHRYDPDTIGKLRIDYLHRMQRIYESEIVRMQDMIDNSKDAREVAAATKRKEKLAKQLKETKAYDEKIAHLALARIELDLDDGVVVNYEKVQTGTDGRKLEVLAKI